MKLLRKKNYLALIRNSAKGENNMFRNLYADIDGKEQDILRNGKVSCAVFVSAVLMMSELVKTMHARIEGLERDLRENGWKQTPEPCEGAILIWEKQRYQDGQEHGHAGFYVGNKRAISNSSNDRGVPIEHHWTYDGKRKVVRMYWYPTLDNE